MNNILKFELDSKSVQIKKILNKEFLDIDVYAISTIYPNRNKSAFTEESLLASMDTCYNKPILGAFNNLLNDFDQHNGENKYDKDYENVYWDNSGSNDEKPLGLIRESDHIEIVDIDGIKWLKISCAIWTKYSYKQVKNLLKSSSKKVSVEIMVTKSHKDETGEIEIIDQFVLMGITILGDKVSEGIPNAHLNIMELMAQANFEKQMECLSFAYNQKDTKQNINSDKKTELYNKKKELEAKTLAYMEKFNLLEEKFSINEGFKMVAYSDNAIIVYSIEDEKFYSVNYTITTNEDVVTIDFDIENKCEQAEAFKEFTRETIAIGENQKNIDEIYAMYQQTASEKNELQSNFDELKSEFSNKVYSITIDEVEYNVESLKQKYDSDMQAKADELSQISTQLNEKTEECDQLACQLNQLKEQREKEIADKLCDDGIKLADEEDDLDEDDKKEIKEKCSKHLYHEISEVEDDIARALYQKKKNNRSKVFKSNTSYPTSDTTDISVFDKL